MWELCDTIAAAKLLSESILASAKKGMADDYGGFGSYVAEAFDPYFIDNRFYYDYKKCLRRIYSVGGSDTLYCTLCRPSGVPSDWWRTAMQSRRRDFVSTPFGGYAIGGDDDSNMEAENIPFDDAIDFVAV